MYKGFVFILSLLSFSLLAFNDSYQSASIIDPISKYGDVTGRVIANLPYSACELDTPPIPDNHCRLVSLKFGSSIFNKIFYNYPMLNGLDYQKVNSSTANALKTNYFVSTQEGTNDIWQVPTIEQLEWMRNQNLIQAQEGEFFWAKQKNSDTIRRVYFRTMGSFQNSDVASIQRLATTDTPSGCTEGVNCNNFTEIKDAYIQVVRSNIVHDMHYAVYIDGRKVLDSYSSRKDKVKITPLDKRIEVRYATNNSGALVSSLENLERDINWSYNQPVVCVISNGTVFNMWTSKKSIDDLDSWC